MLYKFFFAVGAVYSASANTLPPHHPLDVEHYRPHDIIRRDVAVIGGGSSGTYTSVRLKDNDKSVVLIEKEEKLGGHAQTYTTPDGYTIDYGVIVFAQKKVVEDYFSRFNVSLIPLPSGARDSTYVDFNTGKLVNFTLPDSAAAFETYAKQLAKYPALQKGFDLTYPVPEDLLITFGDFVKKYDLGALVPLTFITNQGYGNILDLPMLYMFKYLNSDQLNSTANGYLTTKNHNIYALYAAAGEYLGSPNVLTGSMPIAMDRSSCPVKILVQTPRGKKLILAEKVVCTIPPTLPHLAAYDLSSQEKNLFKQWTSNGYYTGILNNTGFKQSSFLGADPKQPYDTPKLPGVYTMGTSAVTNLTQVYYGSPTVLSNEEVKSNIERSLQRLQKEQGLPQTKVEWLIFSSHSPFNLGVSTAAIKGQFYKKLYALNGQKNTFYNGAAFHTQDSSVLWQFTEDYVLPMILNALK